MGLIEIIKKQEAQSRLALTDEERREAIAFFEDREREWNALDAVILQENGKYETNKADGINLLRDDIAAPNASREAFLTQAPDTDGAFIRVPRAL